MPTLIYVHGLDGSPADPLPRLVRHPELTVVAPDGRFSTLARRAAGVREAIAAHPGAVVVGVGLGALAALAVAAEDPTKVAAVVLLGPALTWSEPPVFDPDTVTVPRGLRVVVYHGTEDAVTPVEASRALAGRFPQVTLHTPVDVHDLRGALPAIAREVRNLLPGPVRPPARPPRPAKPPRPPRPARPPRPPRAPRAAPRTPAADARPAVPKPPKKSPRPARAPKPEPYARQPLVLAVDLDGRPQQPPLTLLHRWSPVIPDGFGRSLDQRVADVAAAVAASGPCLLGGFGYGAVVALRVADLHPKLVRGLLLLGPSLDGADAAVSSKIPVVLVRGSRDVVCSPDDAQALVRRSPHVRVVTCEDGHDLGASGPAVVGALQDLQAAAREK
jgi:pimeloyl-ACP methyl ester carboxylesterase